MVKWKMTPLLQLHFFLWTGRQLSYPSMRPSSLTSQLSLIHHSSTCPAPPKVRSPTVLLFFQRTILSVSVVEDYVYVFVALVVQ